MSDEALRPLDVEARRLRDAAVALTISFALVLAPNAIGLLARLSTLLLRRFSAWWPPTSLEPLPLGVAGLVLLVTAYALATRGSRMRRPGFRKRRRFLPPLDLLLLQLGNVTFLAFLLVLTVVTLGLLSSALRALVSMPWLVANGLAASLTVAAAGAFLGLRRPLPAGSWNALRRRWSRGAAILGGAVGGFWLIGRASERSLLKIRLADSQVDPSTLASLYALLWIVLAGCVILARFERSLTEASGSTALRLSLALTSPLTWATYLGFLTLYLNGAFLTLREHLAGT
jgi:hypothetical protein